jgi:hypothetical protein
MLKDPRSAGPRPPFPKQQQSAPGETGKLIPTPDHGEESYRGADRLTNFTAGLAQVVAKDGIRVNAVVPGPVWTPLIPSTMSAEKAANFGADSPLGRPGQPAEVAPAYVFLASNDATYISGAVLPVTGGKPFL